MADYDGKARRCLASCGKLKIPDATGPFSQSVQLEDTIYISGQIGLDPSSMEMVGRVDSLTGEWNDRRETVEMEVRQALQNMEGILKAAGASFNNVMKTTVLLTDIKDLDVVDEVYKAFFASNYPARQAYQVGPLPKGAMVSIEAIAVTGKITDDKTENDLEELDEGPDELE